MRVNFAGLLTAGALYGKARRLLRQGATISWRLISRKSVPNNTNDFLAPVTKSVGTDKE